jgi:hypothetical protein
MQDIINIQDVALLRITRVRDWSILFDYGDKHYLIHGKYECGEGSWQELYERELDNNGRYSLNYIKNITGDEYVIKDYIKNWNKKSIVYSQINKEYFAYKLVKRGFAHGIYEDLIEGDKEQIRLLKGQLREYEDECRKIRSKINKLS